MDVVSCCEVDVLGVDCVAFDCHVFFACYTFWAILQSQFSSIYFANLFLLSPCLNNIFSINYVDSRFHLVQTN